jgi:YidC/Oxa1 family membrane protein insertase
MKFMMYLMPLLLFVWFNGYSAALSYYYFLSNLISIGQIYFIRRTIDEEKLLRQLQENVKKNKGKKTMSSWQQRLMEENRKRAEMQRKRKR